MVERFLPVSRVATVVAMLTAMIVPWRTAPAQILETETARPLRAGQLEVGAAYEFQHSREGDEIAIPIAFELGITNRLGLLVEPVPYTAIRPEVGQSATGPGDLEVTASYLLRRESGRFPAFAIAAEEKVPTARNNLIGTGKPDHAAYVIASKRFGRFDAHANVGYTFVGSPRGQSLNTGSWVLSPRSLQSRPRLRCTVKSSHLPQRAEAKVPPSRLELR